jgi:peptidoglycan/xylan/chitin deacetylase (PgdA/CDA1 family)
MLKSLGIAVIAIVLLGMGVFAMSSTQQNSVAPENNADAVVVEQLIQEEAVVIEQSSPEMTMTVPNPVQNIPILVYHSIAPAPTDRTESTMQKRFRVSPENFKAQMQYLQDNNYTPITFRHVSEYLLTGKAIPEKPVVLTFDDGLLNQYEYAIPVLRDAGFSATFFIYPGVTAHRGFMHWEQLAEIVDDGHEIGSHSVIHYNLTTVDDATLQNELVASKKTLEEKLGITVNTIAYPHYAENEIVRAAVSDAGYISARAGWRAVTNSADEILHLKAQEVGNGVNPFVGPR